LRQLPAGITHASLPDLGHYRGHGIDRLHAWCHAPKGECERTVAEIGPDGARRIPAGMTGRPLGEKDVRELMERLAEAKPPRSRKR